MGRSITVCSEPGCPTLTPGGKCPEHKAKVERTASRRRRASQGPQPYDTAAWQRTRARYRAQHPTCNQCARPTAHVDHTIPRRILVAAGIHTPDADQWLQPLCATHHNRKTQLIDVPLLKRLNNGEDPATLAQEATRKVG